MAFPTYIPAYGGFNRGYFPTQQTQIPQQFQPQSQQIQAVPTQQQNSFQNGLNWIEGAEAAKAYIVAPNCTVVLFDTKEPVMYIKSADLSGMPSTRTFKIEEIGDKPIATATAETVSKDEIVNLKERISALEKQIQTFKAKENPLREELQDEPSL